MSYMSEPYFWVFIHELCFWMSNLFCYSYHCMAWGQAYFSEGGRWDEVEDMVDTIDYYIGGDWAPQLWSSRRLSSLSMIIKNWWTCLYVYLSLCTKIFSTLVSYLLFWIFCLKTYARLSFCLIYTCFDIFCYVSVVVDYI